ncbi:NADP-dependent malic enzyme [Chloroflexota bacterium]|nr:NADP-dependent malic enzyme [Chloroflexota bacterium]
MSPQFPHQPSPEEIEKLLAKASQPAQDAIRLHEYFRGKMSTLPKCPVEQIDDFSIWYTPGVAAPCKEIAQHPERVYDLTNKGNLIAVVSDGSRVLGLGDIGPEAGLPVMEGKAMLFKYLGGVDAVPIMLEPSDPEPFIETVLRLQPGFGGINLEDISQPKCFEILDRLRGEARIPVWHDDQQGTATVTLAGLMNALKLVGKDKGDIRITFVGSGAAGVACSRLIFAWGVDPAKATMVDVRGILGKHRNDFPENTPQHHLCQVTNQEGREGGIEAALQGADVVISYSQPGPGVILPEWIRGMAADPIVFACANPVPEIWPWEAQAAGAAVVATGRSDFPNQVNNSLSFPGIFRGVLDVRASTITDEMCFAAAKALAEAVGDSLDGEHLLPRMMDMEIYPLQAAAVGLKAQEQGIASLKSSRSELLNRAEYMIGLAQSSTDVLMEAHCIPPFPEN